MHVVQSSLFLLSDSEEAPPIESMQALGLLLFPGMGESYCLKIAYKREWSSVPRPVRGLLMNLLVRVFPSWDFFFLI